MELQARETGSELPAAHTEIPVKRTPSRVLHFSDGTMEDCSSDEEEEIVKEISHDLEMDTTSMTWGPWMWYQTVNAGSKTLQVCDYLGESLASFFGITSPKYQYEIEEYRRMVAEEEEERKQQDLEMGGWSAGSAQTLETGDKEKPGPDKETPGKESFVHKAAEENDAQRY